MVLVKKYIDDIKICLDPHGQNKAIQWPHYHLSIIDDILPKLNEVRFSILSDAKSGFWQVRLGDKSSFVTTFNTPFGRFQWLKCCLVNVWYQKYTSNE